MVARTLDKRFGSVWKTFVGIHFDEVGKAKGEWVVRNTKPGKVAMLLGPAGALVMVEQEKSFRAAIEPAGYKVAFAQNSTQTRENGLKLTEDALVANPDLVAIYASNDDLALGATQAVKAAGASAQDCGHRAQRLAAGAGRGPQGRNGRNGAARSGRMGPRPRRPPWPISCRTRRSPSHS